jgi:tRNA nucleotidyltransferase (CCA-adding enzyme)
LADILVRVAAAVRAKGGRAFYVGGCVRDRLLGIASNDIDVEVFGLAPAELEGILAGFGPVNMVGKSFGVYRVPGIAADFALPRRERKTGSGHRDFAVTIAPDLDVADAARRRDFTVNSLMKDILTGEVIDCCGGREDLGRGIIRHVSDQSFGEDPLRVYRAAQLAARLAFAVHPETVSLCRAMDLSSLSPERIMTEWEKMLLLAERPSIGLTNLREMDVLAKRHPRLAALSGCPQNPVFHPEGDVWAHTLLVVDAAAQLRKKAKDPRVLMWAALLHDIAKPEMTKLTDGKYTSRGHDGVGAKLADVFLAELRADKSLRRNVAALIKEHMLPFVFYRRREEVTPAALRRLANRVDLGELLLLAQADFLGKGGKRDFAPVERWFAAKIAELDLPLEKGISPLVQGRDLLAMGLAPGPNYTAILERAFELQLAGETRAAILEKVAEWIGSGGAEDSEGDRK